MAFPGVSELHKWQLFLTFLSITCSTGLFAIVNGMFTIEIPTIAHDVGLEDSLLLWALSIASLVTAATLLLGGSLVDVLGGKSIYVAGTMLQGLSTLASGLARDSSQTIVFRGVMGLSQSLCLPSSVKIIIDTFPEGRWRNLAFASMGGGQPVGFALGLVLGGVLAGTWGWRQGLYLIAGLTFGVVILTSWGLRSPPSEGLVSTPRRLRDEIDWVGVLIASIWLASIGYVLASISVQPENIKQAVNITLLSVAALLPPFFVLWMERQASKDNVPLIPNSIWKNTLFRYICLSVLLTWGAFNSIEQILSLWLQVAGDTTPIMTGIQYLPQTIVGIIVNTIVGLSLHCWPAGPIIIGTTLLGVLPPIILALSDPNSSYWAAAFPALSIIVIGPDSLYIISNILISKEFPISRQGLAGGIFNTVAQVGKSIGLALSAVISSVVSQRSKEVSEAARLTEGYKAAFWFLLALNIVAFGVGVIGLRGLG
ncbi:integral membrane protein [Xylaria bambusicola]|uniref:uncharacterized protein n=1 Tax=Xylaria bambusicola TaxID=326684 RepID=UPI002008823A|nr:uncharacterized protein F5B22DRAFT_634575 [Xylaria bambusicola]KAI0521700.1 integral membrane protein [Xylaria bambusicola]